MKSPPWWIPQVTPLIQFVLIGAFLVAYFRDPDDTMKGALLAAFAAAWGYSIGSSKGAAENRDVLNRAADKSQDALAQLAGAGPQPPAVPMGEPKPPITTEEFRENWRPKS